MGSQNTEKEQIIRELIECQQRINELEALGSQQKETILEARAMFENLFESSPEALIVVDRRGYITRLNIQAESLFGYTRQELIGKDHGILVPEQVREKHAAALKTYMEQPRIRVMGIGLELWGRRKDGTEFPADIDLGPLEIDKELFVLSIVRDATKRKGLEIDLQESEQKYRELADLFPEVIFETDVQGTLTYANRKALDSFNINPEDMKKGISIFDYVTSKYRSVARQRFSRVLREGDIGTDEYALLKKDGTTFPALVHSASIARHGITLGVRGIAVDITERKQAELGLAESEKRFRTTLDAMLEGCVIIDFHWRYLYVNKAAVRIGHRTKKARLGHTMMEVFPGIEKQDTFSHLQKCMKDRVPDHYQTEFTFPEGNRIWFEVRAEPVPEGILILYEDITERKKLEEELKRYRQRLEQTVAERTAEFAEVNEKLTRQMEEHRKAEAGLVLRATILDNAREAIFLINPEGYFAYANEAAIKTYGYSRDEFLSMNLSQLLRTEEALLIPGRFKEVLRMGQMELETIHVRKDRSLMPVQVRHNLIKTLHGQFIVSVMRDMTDEFRLRLLLEQVPGIVWVTDSKLTLTLSAGTAPEMLGLKPGEGAGMPLAEYLEKNDLGTEFLAAHQRALAGASSSFEIENKKLGKTFYGWAAPLLDAQGKLAGTISIAVDAGEYQPV
ncbi:MAG: PAS domain S-box protein [Dehalococcoidales bacterium]|nr:PAS domain S-box protein [Dehalococcoidales bacterium]